MKVVKSQASLITRLMVSTSKSNRHRDTTAEVMRPLFAGTLKSPEILMKRNGPAVFPTGLIA